jgi:hypothetical protein
VKYTKDHDAVSIEDIEHGEWKSMQQCTAHRPVNHRETVRDVRYCGKCGKCRVQEFLPKASPLLLVPAADSAKSCSASGRRRTSIVIGDDE